MTAAESLLPTWGDRIMLIVLVAVVWLALRYGFGILSHKNPHRQPTMSVDCKMDWHDKCIRPYCECECHHD